MSFLAIISGVSMAVNAVLAIAAALGWKKAAKVQAVADTVVKGVEAVERLRSSDDAGTVKKAVKSLAVSAGILKDVQKVVDKVTK